MALPDRVEIEPEPDGGHCMMYRYGLTGEFCGDTWHEDLDAAFLQAEYEYGLGASDFLAVPGGRPDRGQGGAT